MARKRQAYSKFYLEITDNEFKQLITAWLTYCRVEGFSDQTLYLYSDRTARFLWWWSAHTSYNKTLGANPRSVTPKEAREFVSYLREPEKARWGSDVDVATKLAPATIANYGRVIRTFFHWLENELYIPKSPFQAVKFTVKKQGKAPVKNLSTESLAKIFSVLTNPTRLLTFTGKRDLAIISLLLDSGVRRGELLSMSFADLDMIRLRLSVSGKTGPRIAHFSDNCKGVLLDYLKARADFGLEKADSPLWINDAGQALDIAAFNSIIRRICARSGVKFGSHRLRHTFGLLMSSKVSLFEVRDLLGHKSITTTQIYVENTPETLEPVLKGSSEAPMVTAKQ